MDPSMSVWEVIRPNFHIGLNLFLAFVPLGLSYWLFRKSHRRSLIWWLGVALFIAFLPNAPYTLTDIIHFLAKIQIQPPLPGWAIILLIILFGIYFVVGFQAYVLSLINLGSYLKRQEHKTWIVPIELGLHALSAVGIYLGRFQRLNSWNIITTPEKVFHQTVEDLIRRRPLETMILLFLAIMLLYYLVKAIDLAILKPKRRKT